VTVTNINHMQFT